MLLLGWAKELASLLLGEGNVRLEEKTPIYAAEPFISSFSFCFVGKNPMLSHLYDQHKILSIILAVFSVFLIDFAVNASSLNTLDSATSNTIHKRAY